MGRSNLKYRSARGRGQGDSARGGGRGGGGEKPRRSGGRGGRALESNAFRYEERSDEVDGDGTAKVDATGGADMRRQFFAGEQKYRNLSDVKESYFRTKAVQQWDADGDDSEADAAVSALGGMDFAWIADQLSLVAPSRRFQIDTRYCVDFAFDDPAEASSTPDQVSGCEAITDSLSSLSLSPTAAAMAEAAKPLPVMSGSQSSSALDDLLTLSTSTAAKIATMVSAAAPPATASNVAATIGSIPGDAQENLEDWLDDVLDM